MSAFLRRLHRQRGGGAPQAPNTAEPGGTRRPVAGALRLRSGRATGLGHSQRGGVLLWILLLLLLAAALGTAYLLRTPLLRAFAEWWIVEEPLEKAQAIVVLGGDNFAADRVRHAVALYRAGWAPRVIVSGARLRPYLSEADLMQRDATALGLPAEHLLVARHDAHSTLGEALALRSVLAEHNFRKVIVVTSNFHTRRTQAIFRAVYQRQGTQVLVSPAPDSNFDPARWWQQREARELLLLELLKTPYTWWELFRLSRAAAAPPQASVCLSAGSPPSPSESVLA